MTDGDCLITANVFCAVFCSLGYDFTEAEVEDVLSELDTDEDGIISLDDFWAADTSEEPDVDDGAINGAFMALDKDGDGHISPAELKFAMASLGEQLLSSPAGIVYGDDFRDL